ncbi:MAG: hypothetical protein ACRD4Y_15910, partial [Candidatus Acidiferrales bacterium]
LAKAACFVGGFLSCYTAREPRLQDPLFAKTRRTQQKRRMSSMVGKKERVGAGAQKSEMSRIR